MSVQKSLISNLSNAVESKILTINERNLTSTQWVEYHNGTKRKTYNSLPTSNITAEAVTVDGFTLTQTDNSGVTTTASRSYTASGMIHTRTDARNTSRQGTVKNDTFGYNNRSELTSATVIGSNYAYDYDNIGNRETATESDITTNYTANELNQYTAVGDFTPTFDADGNQTLVKTSTGTWEVAYDAENRPVSFTNAESRTVVECDYDSMGHRATKKVTIDGEVTLHQRYLYRGYLQIACCDLTRSNHPALWLITRDPTQPIATRPLAIQKDATWYTYGYIRTSYTYSPYGSVTESGNTWQPIQWSSEYNDTEPGLVYYNYRHYTPLDGRWIGRDFIYHRKSRNAYFFGSMITNTHDVLGLIPKEEVSLVLESLTDDFFDNIIRWWYDDSVRIDKKEDFPPIRILVMIISV